MAKISAAQVKELRDKTGVGMMDAKKALVETEGDMEKAVDVLREKGVAKPKRRVAELPLKVLLPLPSKTTKLPLLKLTVKLTRLLQLTSLRI